MSTQHTPGPWRVKYPLRATERLRIVTDTVKTQEIATVAKVYGGCDYLVYNVNARLIAAAPELLAVLRRVQPHLEGQRDRYAKLGLDAAFEDYENLIQAARAVIAKAEGQS